MATKTKETTSPGFKLTDISTWGVEHNDAVLDLDCSCPLPLDMGPCVIDVENNADGSCAGIGFTLDGDTIYFRSPEQVEDWPKNILKDVPLVGHNVKYDVQMLRKWGFNVSPDQIVWDTQIAEYVRDSTRFKFGLKPLVKEIFGAEYPDYKAIAGRGKSAVSIGDCDPTVVANYCGCDVLFTYRLYEKQLAEMTEQQVSYLEEMELPTMRALLEMEERGVQIDACYVRSLDARFGEGICSVVNRIRSVANAEINLNSHQQIRQLLLDKAGLKLESTGAEILKDFKSVSLVKDILRYRELSKLKATYVDTLIERSPDPNSYSYRLNARFNQTSTDTGRLSSSDPNLQNIPTRTEDGALLRQAFIAKPGHLLIDLDYSQIEPRLMAHISGDKNLQAVFNEGHDLYDYVSKVTGLLKTHTQEAARKISKILWLAMAYNAGAWKIAQTAGITRNEAEVFLTRMKMAFPQFFYWRAKVIANAEISGFVTTMFGRVIPIDKEFAHKGPNYVVQGSAAEVMKLALQATRHLGGVLTVHDELVFEATEEDAADLQSEAVRIMESVVVLSVPLVVEAGIGRTWGDAKG